MLSTRLLLAAGADFRSVNQYGEPLLVEAVYSGRAEMVKLLFAEGYEVRSLSQDLPRLPPREITLVSK